jgi:hypothetical protein
MIIYCRPDLKIHDRFVFILTHSRRKHASIRTNTFFIGRLRPCKRRLVWVLNPGNYNDVINNVINNGIAWFLKLLFPNESQRVRRYDMALDLLNAVAETWGPMHDDATIAEGAAITAGKYVEEKIPNEKSAARKFEKIDPASEAAAAAMESSPYLPCLGAACTTSLLGAAVDSWDKLRVSAFNLLTRWGCTSESSQPVA